MENPREPFRVPFPPPATSNGSNNNQRGATRWSGRAVVSRNETRSLAANYRDARDDNGNPIGGRPFATRYGTVWHFNWEIAINRLACIIVRPCAPVRVTRASLDPGYTQLRGRLLSFFLTTPLLPLCPRCSTLGTRNLR